MAGEEFARQMAQWSASLPTAQQQGAVCGILPDVQLKSLCLQGLKSDNMIMPKSQRGPGPLGKILADMGFDRTKIMEGLKTVSGGAPVTQAGIADITGSGLPGGGSFASMASSGPSTDFGI